MGKEQITQDQSGNGSHDAVPDEIKSDIGVVNDAENGEFVHSVDESDQSETFDEEVGELSLEAQLAAMADEISHLKNESAEQFERFQRLSAEYTNYQKRKDVEIQKARKFSIDQFAKAMLDVMESLDQACESEPGENVSPEFVAMHEGVELTRKQLSAAFERFGIEEVNPGPGTAFDANFHQAMTMQPSTEYPPNHVSEVFRKGYRLHDRLLRPAMVIVASQPTEETE